MYCKVKRDVQKNKNKQNLLLEKGKGEWVNVFLRTDVHIAASKTSLKQDAHSLIIKAVQRPWMNEFSVYFTDTHITSLTIRK